jgi:hypothetical protein
MRGMEGDDCRMCEINVEQLPENILLEIMTYLNVKDRLSAAR